MHLGIQTLVAGILLVLSVGAGASMTDCDQPSAPASIPDGKTASESEMLEAQKLVKEYVGRGQAFLSCIEKEIEETKQEVVAAMKEQEGDKKSAEQSAAAKEHQQLVDTYNKIVSKMEEVAGEFNQALKDYNASAE